MKTKLIDFAMGAYLAGLYLIGRALGMHVGDE